MPTEGVQRHSSEAARRQRPRSHVLALRHGAGWPWVSHLTTYSISLPVHWRQYLKSVNHKIPPICVAGDSTRHTVFDKGALGRNLLPHLPHVTKGGEAVCLTISLLLKNPCCTYYTSHRNRYICNLTRSGKRNLGTGFKDQNELKVLECSSASLYPSQRIIVFTRRIFWIFY